MKHWPHQEKEPPIMDVILWPYNEKESIGSVNSFYTPDFSDLNSI